MLSGCRTNVTIQLFIILYYKNLIFTVKTQIVAGTILWLDQNKMFAVTMLGF